MNTLIITGGNNDIEFSKEYLKKYSFDLVIAADKGLETINKLNIIPNYVIGDFDSLDKNILQKYDKNSTQIIRLSPEKDYTDTHMALKLAIEKKSDNITILGAVGTRVDHTLGNINILKEALMSNIQAKIVNSNNEIFLINTNTELKKDDKYKYVSLIPLTTKAVGVTLKGFKYPLTNQLLNIGESLGISNEQKEEKAIIELKEGILIIVKSRD